VPILIATTPLDSSAGWCKIAIVVELVSVVLAAVGLAGLAWLLTWVGSRGLRRQVRFIESLGLTPEASLAEGPIQLEGTALTDTPLRAPLSGKEALAWQLSIGVLEEVGDGGKVFCAVTPVFQLAPFKLRLGLTEIVVSGEPHHIVPATYDASAADTRRIQTLTDEAQQVALAAIRRGPYRYDVSTNEPLVMKERLIRPGVEVFVLGCARWSKDRQEWRVEPGESRPLVLIEGTREEFLRDLRRGRRSLDVDYPLHSRE